MAIPPWTRTNDTKARIIRLAQKYAFDSYLRRGRVPEVYERLARGQLHKRSLSQLSLKALGEGRPTTHYTWRTARDERVRSTHAANEGRVFSWSDAPSTGHPGHAPNCRCWPEPYYGTPGVSDLGLPLRHERRTDTSGRTLWASIETLTRPDGSLAESSILLRNNTRMHSTFTGSSVTHNVLLPDGRHVRVENRDGVQAFYDGDRLDPLARSTWTADGPVLLGPKPGREFEQIELFNPAPVPPTVGDAVGGAILLGLLALQNTQHAEPASLGAGADDVPLLAMRAWRQQGRPILAPISQVSISVEQAGEACKYLPAVQDWTNTAARKFASERSELGPRIYGIKVHTWIKREIDKGKEAGLYGNLRAELSLLEGEKDPVHYSRRGSTRLDIFENRLDDGGYVCVYDIKTGGAELTAARIKDISLIVLDHYGPVPFVIVEVKPVL